jgi:predicted nucleic acid-binding protein
MNVFLDTNVIIDFMGEREGFFDYAAAIFAMIEDKRITASASALTRCLTLCEAELRSFRWNV